MTSQPVSNLGVDYAKALASENLRAYIESCIRLAFSETKGAEKDTPKEYQEALNLWANITADRIIAGFTDFLPEPIDIEQKWEVKPNSGVHITLSAKNDAIDHDRDMQQLDYLSSYADDEGYNRYHYTVKEKIENLYKAGEIALDYKGNQERSI
jgi:hypothetical protein